MAPVPLWTAVVVQLVLLLLTGYLSMLKVIAEFLNENRMERLAEDGEVRAARILPLLPQMEDAEDCMRTGVTLMTLLSGLTACFGFAPRVMMWVPFFAEGTLQSSLMIVLMALLMVLFTQLFCIVLPRRLTLLKMDALTIRQFGALRNMRKVFYPINRLVTFCADSLIKLAGSDPAQADEQVTEDEILAMVDKGEEKGGIESNEKEMIENIFEFNNLSAEDCMTHRTNVSAIALDSTKEEILEVFEESGKSRFPVYDEDIDNIVGVLTTREYLLNMVSPAPKPLRELLRPAYFVPETVRTDVLFHEMQKKKNHIAIVVDEYGGTSGLITMEDLLEQIVGNIFDEFDPQDEQEQDIIPQADGSWRVSGTCDLDTLCETLGLESISDEEYDTVGGLVFSQLTAIPEDGSHPEVECFGLHILVEKLNDRHVEWTIIRKIDTKPSEEEEK